MAENILAMTLRMRNQATTTARNMGRELESGFKKGQQGAFRFGKAVKATRTSVGSLAGSMVSLKTIIAATFIYKAVQRFGKFLKSLVDLSLQQEDVSRKLAENLKAYGKYSAEVVDLLHQHANALQQQTGIANETTEANMALLASYGMTADQIREVTPLIIDFAMSHAIELKTAFDLIGKASVGYTGTLSRYGIILDKTLSVEEKWAAVLQELANYQGVAAGLAQTRVGQLRVLKEAYADLKKTIGAIVMSGLEHAGVVEWLNRVVDDSTGKLEKWGTVLGYLAGVTIEKMVENVKKMGLALVHTFGSPEVLGSLTALWAIIKLVGSTFTFAWKSMWSAAPVLSSALAYAIGGIIYWLKRYQKTMMETTQTFHWWLRFVPEWKSALQTVRVEVASLAGDLEMMGDETKRAADRFDKMMEGPGGIEETYLERLKQVGELLSKTTQEFISGRSPAERWLQDLKMLNAQLGDGTSALEYWKLYVRDAGQEVDRTTQEIEKMLEVTATMERQFALAGPLERARVKYLMGWISEAEPADVGELPEEARKLISRFGVLQALAERRGLFREFTATELGDELSRLRGQELLLRVELTDEAKELLNLKVQTVDRLIESVTPRVR